MKELYRKLLMVIFPQSPSLQMLFPGVPQTPWNRHRSKKELAAWYWLKTTNQAFAEGFAEGFKKSGHENFSQTH